MGKFLVEEKNRYIALKESSALFSKQAKIAGEYKGVERPFCLPEDYAAENLYEGIRKEAKAYFQTYEVKWHDGRNGNPSNHLCDSQVCCVNFLFPFAREPEALAELLKPLYPDIRRTLPLEGDDIFVSFEWIGLDNYLGEKINRSQKRTRGANYTSADAAVRFERGDGSIQLMLIEWKYTESYYSTPLKYAKSGTDRTKIYEPLYLQDDCPLDKALIPHFDDLFFEPFYQLMRQQLLAHQMELAGELGASKAIVLHLAPDKNRDFHRVTSPGLKHLGESATEVWKRIVKDQSAFVSQNVENLFSRFPAEKHPSLIPWRNYMAERYAWAFEKQLKEAHL